MIFALLNFISAIAISGVAAYFSILGLATIFPGSVVAVIVMAGSLEVGKLVGSVWLHRNWTNAPRYIRYYLLVAVVVLSLITSMGIFGFLSKSHIEHDFSFQQNSLLIAKKEEQIKRLESSLHKVYAQDDVSDEDFQRELKDYQSKLDTYKKRLEDTRKDRDDSLSRLYEDNKNAQSQLDKIAENRQYITENTTFSLSSKLKKFDEENKQKIEDLNTKIKMNEVFIRDYNIEFKQRITEVNLLIDTLKKPQRNAFQQVFNEQDKLNIEKTEDQIELLTEEKFKLESNQMKIEAEVGPIKYISAFLKDFFNVKVEIETSVRVVIVILIFVFDPLAILLLIGAAISWENARTKALPPDELKIRKELLEELEDYMSQGGSVKMFLDRHS